MKLTRRDFGMGAAALGLTLMADRASARMGKPKGVDVIVLGAGVSGLNAAWLLEQQGLKVLLLEGRQRVGGRVFTLLDQPGYPEMGFNSMGEGYGRGIDAATRAGVELENVVPRFHGGPPQELYLDGQRITREEWAGSPINPFPEHLKRSMPWEVTNKMVSQNNRLPDSGLWNDPANAKLDISLYSFLKAQGLSDAAINLVSLSPYYGTSAYDVSALMLEFNDGFIKSQIAAGPRVLAIKGGNIKLPNGMAKLLKGDILFGKDVVAIDNLTDKAEVRCADGSVYSAPRVISSLPLPTLRNIAIRPGLSGPQAMAVAELKYQPLSIAFLTVTEPFWEHDDTSPAMWTDDRMGVVMPQRFGADPKQITGLTVQARGHLAQHWDRLGKEDALTFVVQRLEALRPAAKGKVKGAHLHSWTAERFNMGAFSYFGPGQIAAFGATMAEPAGRIHFCGEHTAVGARGLEGALESSERVAIEILSL
ncbi:flavin monoamine oxidase family protein [Parasphingorhabdus sp.]|uniref:flavin monoamine oxidase family protein n=1 Tax=Parasphingorhabdus sp. TaxID=2709688 RepID=UPI002F9329BF